MRVVVASLVTALLIVVTGATPAGAEPSDGIRVEGSVTYEVQPREERVRVTISRGELTSRSYPPRQRWVIDVIAYQRPMLPCFSSSS